MTTDLVPVTTHGGHLATTGCGCGDDHEHGGCLHALQRNLFFPRKLMEVRHWQAEQAYHRHARELVTRLGLGAGVLCGLEVKLSGTGTLVVGAGPASTATGGSSSCPARSRSTRPGPRTRAADPPAIRLRKAS